MPAGNVPTPNLRRYRRSLRLQDLGFDSYPEYLKSRHWRSTRARFAASEQPQDCICGETEGLQLHHLTYERIGAEEMSDLMWVCPTCHAMIHTLEVRGEIGLDLTGFVSEKRAARHAAEQAKRDAGPVWEEIHEGRLSEIKTQKLRRDVGDLIRRANKKDRTEQVVEMLAATVAECHEMLNAA